MARDYGKEDWDGKSHVCFFFTAMSALLARWDDSYTRVNYSLRSQLIYSWKIDSVPYIKCLAYMWSVNTGWINEWMLQEGLYIFLSLKATQHIQTSFRENYNVYQHPSIWDLLFCDILAFRVRADLWLSTFWFQLLSEVQEPSCSWVLCVVPESF